MGLEDTTINRLGAQREAAMGCIRRQFALLLRLA
jgi:hypothetical protein